MFHSHKTHYFNSFHNLHMLTEVANEYDKSGWQVKSVKPYNSHDGVDLFLLHMTKKVYPQKLPAKSEMLEWDDLIVPSDESEADESLLTQEGGD